jgi:hypothetical protein
MEYKQCICCHLNLPLSVLVPVQIQHQGKLVIVPLCITCKKIEDEKRKTNGKM